MDKDFATKMANHFRTSEPRIKGDKFSEGRRVRLFQMEQVIIILERALFAGRLRG
jgi:hypothetical protein